MWLIGLLIGLVVGGLLHGFAGAIIGALAGAALVAMQGMSEMRSRARLKTIEATVDALREQLRRLRPDSITSTPQTIEKTATRYSSPETSAPTPVKVDVTPAAPAYEPANAYSSTDMEQPSYWERVGLVHWR